MLDVSPKTLTLPAGGTATATVTVDPDTGALGLYGGRLTATARDGRSVLNTAVGFDKDQRYTLTLNPIGRNGKPAQLTRYSVWDMNTNLFQIFTSENGPLRMSVAAGSQYWVFAGVGTLDAGGTPTDVTGIIKDQITVNADTEVVLDARLGKPVDIQTPKPTTPEFISERIIRYVPGTGTLITGTGVSETAKLYMVASPPPTRGTMEFDLYSDLDKPRISMKIAGPGVALHPLYLTLSTDATARFDGTKKLGVVFAGAGRPEDYDGRNVRGKIALVRSTPGLAIEDQVAAAAAAKAAVVAVIGSVPGVFQPYVAPTVPLPTLGLSQAEGNDLVRRLGQGTVSLDLEGTAYSPYHYRVVAPYDRVPDGLHYVVDGTNTAVVHSTVHAVRPNEIGAYTIDHYRPAAQISFAYVYHRPFPMVQDRYFTSGDTTYGQTFYAAYPDDGMVSPSFRVAPGQEITGSWFKGPIRANTDGYRGPGSRQGDRLYLAFDSLVDSDGNLNSRQGTTAARVYRDGEQVAQGQYAIGYFDVGTANTNTYRVEVDMTAGRPGWTVGTESYSAWTFRSGRTPATGWTPLAELTGRWDLNLDLNNAAPAGKPFDLRLKVGHEVGAPATPITGAKVWASFDNGGTWKKVTLSGGPDGAFAGTVQHPKIGDTDGYVALKYEASDSDGGKIEQTVYRAYALR
jgi:hypothetical protein